MEKRYRQFMESLVMGTFFIIKKRWLLDTGSVYRMMKKGNMRFLSLLLLLFFFSEAGLAAAPQKLQGKLIDAESGEPVPGAAILIEGINLGTAAGPDGIFSFQNLPSGVYTLSVQAVGFHSFSQEIQHPVDDFLTVTLEPAILQGSEVIVTGSPLGKSISYQPAQALNREKLQEKAAPSLGEILDGNPGVSVRSFGSAPARPVIRGMDGDRVLVLQNGQRMGDLSGTAVDHAVSVDPLSMDRVEIIRGPASLLYGSSAIGGVVNLFTYDMPKEWQKGARVSLASHVATVNDMGAGFARVQQGWDRFALAGSLIYRQGGDIRTPQGKLADTGLLNFSYGTGIGYKKENIETGLSFSGTNYSYGVPEAIDDPNEDVRIEMYRSSIQSISNLQMDRFFTMAELRFHYTDYQHDEIETEINPDGSMAEDLEISFDQQTLGSSLLLRHQPLGRMEGAFGMSANAVRLSVGGVEALTPNADSYFLAAYLYEEITLNASLSMKTGARLEFRELRVKPNDLFKETEAFENRSGFIFSGATGLNYVPGNGWEAGFQIARAFRSPGVEELYSDAPHLAAGSYDIGDPTLKNETSLGTDLFLAYHGNRLYGELSLFGNRIDNYINFSPTGEEDEPSGLPVFVYTATNALLYGVEYQLRMQVTDHLWAKAGLDYVRGRERENGHNLPFMPPFRSFLSLRFDNGNLWGGPRIRMAARQNKVASNEDTTDGYLLLGMDAGYRFKKGLSAVFRIDNILNESYRDHLSRIEDRDNPMPGRNINVILRWDF